MRISLKPVDFLVDLLKDNDVFRCDFDNASKKIILTNLDIPLSRSL